MLEPAKETFQRHVPVSLSADTRLQLEALSAMLQQSTSVVVERSIVAYITSLPLTDRDLIESLVTRARLSLSTRSSQSETINIRTATTVNGKEFVFRGSIEDGIEVLFPNSPPLKITRQSIDKIKHEIVARKGPALMGAIYSPLMPNSIGEAIQKKYGLTPINLSYVIPLLRERNEVQALRRGRTWYVEAISGAVAH